MAEGEILITIKADDSQLKGKLQATERALQQTKRNAEMLNRVRVSPVAQLIDRVSGPLRQIQSRLSGIQKVYKVTVGIVDKATDKIRSIARALASPLAMLGIGGGAAATILGPLKIAGELEQARIAMDYFAGSVEKGQRYLQELLAFAATTPFEFPVLQEALIMLMGANYQFEEAMRALRAFGDAAGMTGAGMQGMQAALLGFTQIAASGTLNLQDLRQVALNLRVPLAEFARHLGIAENEITEVGKKAIPASKAMEAIVKTLEEKYAGGMEKLSKSLLGLTSTLKDTARLTVAAFGEGMAEPVKRILFDLVGLTDYTGEKYKAFQQKLQDAGRRFGEYFEQLYNRAKEFWAELSADKTFQQLDFGGKIIYVIDKALDEFSEWLDGPGGKKVQALFAKLAGIMIKAWMTALGELVKGGISGILHGNILGGIGMLILANMLGLGKLVGGIWRAGKWAFGKLKPKDIAQVAEAAEETSAMAEAAGKVAGVARRAGVLARIAPALGSIARFAWPLAFGAGAIEIATATPERRLATAGRVAGGLAGSVAGMKLGAAIGTAIAPGIGTAIGGAIGAIGGGVVGAFGGEKLFAWLKQIDFAALKEKAISWIKALPGEVAQHLGYIAGYAVEKLSQLPGLFSEWFRQAKDSAIQWIMDLPDQIAGFVGSIPGKVSAAIESVKAAFVSLGKAIPEAIVSGFNWAKERLGAAGQWIIDKAMAGVEAARSLGKQIAEGFEAGRQAAKTTAYAMGGIVTRPHLGIVAEAGPEAIIPLSTRMRSKALELWRQAGEYLGVRPYAFGGIVGLVPAPALGTSAGNVNVTVAGITVNIAGNEVDEENLAMRIGWEIVGHIKRALQNRA